jgi:hypothetical protein
VSFNEYRVVFRNFLEPTVRMPVSPPGRENGSLTAYPGEPSVFRPIPSRADSRLQIRKD